MFSLKVVSAQLRLVTLLNLGGLGALTKLHRLAMTLLLQWSEKRWLGLRSATSLSHLELSLAAVDVAMMSIVTVMLMMLYMVTFMDRLQWLLWGMEESSAVDRVASVMVKLLILSLLRWITRLPGYLMMTAP